MTLEPPTGSDPEERGRQFAALLVGIAAGLGAFGALLGAGFLLYQRLFADSWLALVLLMLVFGALGAYGGWLLGVLVFSAVRGGAPES